MCAGVGNSACHLPPRAPLCETRLPGRGQNRAGDVGGKNIELVGAAGNGVDGSALIEVSVPDDPPAVPIGPEGRLPRRGVDAPVETHNEDVELVLTARDGSLMRAECGDATRHLAPLAPL